MMKLHLAFCPGCRCVGRGLEATVNMLKTLRPPDPRSG